jgi:hypothetical protein
MTFNKSFWSCATLVAVLTGNANAQLAYSSGDVLVCFRNTATPVYDVIVDAGPVANFVGLPAGNKITIATDLLSYVGTNNVAWSACAAVDNFGVSENTWLTKPRASLGTQTVPFNTGRPSVMALIAGPIDGNPSLSYDPVNSYPSGDLPVNTATEVVEVETGHTADNQVTGDCYFYWVQSTSQLAADPGTFGGHAPLPGGVVEQITPANFTKAGNPMRSDFYQLLSNSGTVNNTPGTYLGYFEFSTNGVMTYTSGPSAVVVPAPIITSFTRTGSTNVITFTTVNGGTYNLIGANNLTIPVAGWPIIGSSVAGTGSPMSITNVAADAVNYYRISAH